VCTHYDADHINGILGILESQNFTFDEIWLPEILGSLSYTLSEDLFGILRRLREIGPDGMLIGKASELNAIDESSIIQENLLIKLSALDNILQGKIFPFACDNIAFNLTHASRNESSSKLPIKTMLTNMWAALGIVHSALSSSAYVRWFKYSKSLTNNTCGFGMYALNSTETGLTLYSPDVFLHYLYLTTINVESLVFKFACDQRPDILFCSDSNLSFTNTPIQIKDASVVTAPHHGSDSYNGAYNLIGGSNLIYVRSDESQKKRPGSGFLNQQNRYCTICRNKVPKQKIEISFAGTRHTISGGKCTCHLP
jgi:hypothetical protein